jgi:hypothetical protein
MMVFALLLNALFILGGVAVIVMAMHQRSKRIEMEHRERLAMIERGITPSPETNPAQFEASLGRPAVSRYTTLGVAVVGIGIGLMLLIGVAAGEPDTGIGVGGAVMVLGAAFIVNGYLRRGVELPRSSFTSTGRPVPSEPPRFGRSDPPGPIAP